MVRILLIILLILGFIYIGVLFLLFLTQDRFVYFPDIPGREITQTPGDIGLAFEEVDLITADGVKLVSWFIPAVDARGVALFCHGNAGNISHRLESIKVFHDLRLSVFIFDYRGYGLSEGKVSERGTYEDAMAAWEYLVNEREIPPDRIIFFGRSVGSGVASWLALQNRPGALILESPFTSIPDLGQELYPYFPAKLLCRIKYDNLKNVLGIKCPILIIHSQDDKIVSISHGERLFEKAGEPKEFLKIIGSHDDGFIVSLEEYRKGLDRFIKRHVEEVSRS